MRVAACFVVLLASPTAAAPMQWEGTFTLDWLGESMPPLVLTGSGVAAVNGSNGGAHLASVRLEGGITGSTAVPVTDPTLTLDGIRALFVHETLGTGTIGFGSAELTRSVLPIRGVARLCFYDTECTIGLLFPLLSRDRAAGLGVGGLWTVGGTGRTRVSLVGAPWTIGTAFVTVTTEEGSTFAVPSTGWRHGPGSFTTSTALPGGAFSLVTPIRVTSNQGLDLGGFGRLEIRFVPEPGLLALWAAGLAGVLLLARERL